MSPIEALLIVAAGFAAGTINTIVGSGSLITFPTLLFFGFPPIVANVSNTVGLVPGTASGAIGYRRELPTADRGFLTLVALAIAGGLTGAFVLLALPSTTFEVIVPFLILIASGLMAVQPYLSRSLAARGGTGRSHGLVFDALIYLTAIYGGYFGAAQGVLFISLLSIFQPGNLQRSNAVKNVLALCTNAVAAVVFVLIAHVDWGAALLIAIGSIVGGQVGAFAGRRMRPGVLRWVVVTVGVVVAVKLLDRLAQRSLDLTHRASTLKSLNSRSFSRRQFVHCFGRDSAGIHSRQRLACRE